MDIIGHRGARGLVLENTLDSFRRAVELGVDMVELDVHRLADGVVAVHHDIRLERLTDGTGFIKDVSLEELRRLRLTDGSRVPTLEEALAAIGGGMPVNVELKGAGSAEPTAAILDKDVSSGRRAHADLLVSSFDHRELMRFREAMPQVRIAALYSGIPLDCRRVVMGMDAFSLNISREFVNREFIAEIHEAGMKAFVYTVNREDQMRLLKDMGADGIFTDRPDIALPVSKPTPQPDRYGRRGCR